MTEAVEVGETGRGAFSVNLDPGSSQRWARTVVECTSCGQPLNRRAGAREWIHHATQLRFSSQSGPHLARPRLDTLLPTG